MSAADTARALARPGTTTVTARIARIAGMVTVNARAGAAESTVVNLLESAGLVEVHDPHGAPVSEVGDVRIVEGQVSVLADTEHAHVDRRSSNDGFVPGALSCEVLGRAVHVLRPLDRDARTKVHLEPPSEGRWIVAAQPDVLIELENLDATPIDLVLANQGVQEGLLRHGCREYRSNRALTTQQRPQLASDVERGRRTHLSCGWVDTNVQAVNVEAALHPVPLLSHRQRCSR